MCFFILDMYCAQVNFFLFQMFFSTRLRHTTLFFLAFFTQSKLQLGKCLESKLRSYFMLFRV